MSMFVKKKKSFSIEYLGRHKAVFSYTQKTTQSVLNAIPPIYTFFIPLVSSFTFVSYLPVPEKPITGLPLDACSKQQRNPFGSSHVNVSEQNINNQKELQHKAAHYDKYLALQSISQLVAISTFFAAPFYVPPFTTPLCLMDNVTHRSFQQLFLKCVLAILSLTA